MFAADFAMMLQNGNGASKPDIAVDWAKVPLLRSMTPDHINAYHRCGPINPNQAALGKEAIKTVAKAFDQIFLPAGYTRTNARWHRGPGFAPEPGKPAASKALAGIDTGGYPKSFGQAWRRLRSQLGAAGSPVPLLANFDGSVFIELQKSKYGECFFVNAGVRAIGPAGPSGNHGIVDGFRRFRLQNFLPELPPPAKLDQFYYVRIVEDPRLLRFLLHVVEKRIFPWLEAYTKPISFKRPAPQDMASEGPLPFGAGE
jgi:Domain of unknown function (DUF4304)